MLSITEGVNAARLLIIALVFALAAPAAHAADYSYSKLQEAIRAESVKSATLHPEDGTADVVLRDGRKVSVEYPPSD